MERATPPCPTRRTVPCDVVNPASPSGGARPTPGAPRTDAGLYGRSFADVYDDWYPPDASSDAAVHHIAGLAGGGRVLELGIGTGRLAVPLVRAGVDVVGLDSSPEMIERLGHRCAAVGCDVPEVVLGDAADPRCWPRGPFTVVLAAFNLVCNLVEPDAQATLFASASAALDDGGCLVVESAVPDPGDRAAEGLEVREVTADHVVLIATSRDPSDGVVTGQHIELRDGLAPRLRPWRIRVPSPAELDGWAREHRLELVERRPTWDGTAVDAATADDGSSSWIRTYRRSAPG